MEGSRGQELVIPSVAEVRQSRTALGKLLGQLDLPESTADVTGNARKAAEARWAGGLMARITNPAVIELGPDMWLALLIGPTTVDYVTAEDLRVAWEFHGEEPTQRVQGKSPGGLWRFEADARST